MKAGFSRVNISPPIGTTMMGFGGRDMDHGCEGIHDDIYVRALYVEHGGEKALIMGYDLCFLGRADTDRFRGAIARVMDLAPWQVFLNTSHNHVGPSVGVWYSAGYEAPDRLYLADLEAATLKAAREAVASAREATLWAGATRSALPVHRRRKMPDGSIQNRPNPTGYAYDKLPISLLKDHEDKPICLLFSISCHPSMVSGWEISAEYPGVATRLLDEHLGATASMFLQGCGGDAKPLSIGRDGAEAWARGTWELMEEAGGIVANEVKQALANGLQPVEPHVRVASTEMHWALEPTPPRSFFEDIVANTVADNRDRNVKFMWANHILKRLDRGDTLPTEMPLSMHGITLGNGLRIIGIEGEATAPWGKMIEEYYGNGVTFPLGYTNGEGMYLPTSDMLPEGGYEVISYWEYGLPSGLAAGMEAEVAKALDVLKANGIV
ncbi:MAG: hypothetical protein GY851_35765 [bacterium]|nr:hypothetical protein [bacterium]